MSFGDNPTSRGGKDLPPNPFAAPLAVDEPGTAPPTRFSGETLNPWISIWMQPRATIRQVLDTPDAYPTAFVVALAGAANGFGNAQNLYMNGGAETPLVALIVGSAVGGVVFGFLMWVLFSWLISVAAGWLGGSASLTDMRTAYGWAQVPAVYTIPFSLASLVATMQLMNDAGAAAPIGIALIVIGVGQVVLAVWSIVIVCKAIGEASLFSAWRGLGAIILSLLLCILPLMLMLIFFVVLTAVG